MKFTLIFVCILLHCISGNRLSDILTQSSSQLRNVNKLRSQLPGYIEKRQVEPPVIIPCQDEVPLDPDCIEDRTEYRSTQIIGIDDGTPPLVSSHRLRVGFGNFEELSSFVGKLLSCLQISITSNVFKKVSKRLQSAIIETYSAGTEFYLKVLKCAEQLGVVSSRLQKDPGAGLADKVLECVKMNLREP